MRRGFVFDASLCVGCGACSAACILENGLQAGTRSLYTWNDRALPLKRVISLSLACNHCQEPACAEGCPAKAYTVEESGVVIHHADRCMGCGYCTWRCPYDAPKINEAKGYIEKCHLCHERAEEGIDPACVTACPTGALRFAEQEKFEPVGIGWFPETGIGPSLILKEAASLKGPVIIPSGEADDAEEELSQVGLPERIRKEWSLILFSLLLISASAMMIITGFTDTPIPPLIPLLLLTAAMAVSVAHLGVPGQAWRAVLNITSSPLSQEIVLTGLLTLMALLNQISPGLIPSGVGAITALLTLISVDRVFFAADRRLTLKLHSGQAFFAGIYAVSWFREPGTLFLVFSMLAAISVVMRYRSAEGPPFVRNLYYFRALVLPVVFMLLYPDTPVADGVALALFLAGVAADRLLFYCDFNPVNIRNTIKEHFANEYDTSMSNSSNKE
jgi:Fe-S-cluster-containing dehydrogenase component/DMSO reductase anchor subunit